MVIDFNNQIAFTKLQNKSFLQAETEPREHKTGESVFGLKSFLEPEAGGGAETACGARSRKSGLTWTATPAWALSSQSLSNV